MENVQLKCSRITIYQPNRYPFLMIDKVTEVCPGKWQKDIKTLQIMNVFKHFEDNPNMQVQN